MTSSEVVRLCAYVHALSPSQPMDEYTSDAWSDVFAGLDITLADAKRAAAAVARTRAFIDPHHIIAMHKVQHPPRLLTCPVHAPVTHPEGAQCPCCAADRKAAPAPTP